MEGHGRGAAGLSTPPFVRRVASTAELSSLRRSPKSRAPPWLSRPPSEPRSYQATLWSPSQGMGMVASASAPSLGIMARPDRQHNFIALRHWALRTLRPRMEEEEEEEWERRNVRRRRVASPRPAKPILAVQDRASPSVSSAALPPVPPNQSTSKQSATALGDAKAKMVYKPRLIMQNPYNTIKGSRLARLIHQGAIAVVKSSYFEDCEVRGLPFGRRQDIPFMFTWPGNVGLEMWMKHGKCFLCNVSYCWLSKQHPDPNQYHLRRLVRILAEYKKLWDMHDVGVIMDFCSLWQPDGDKDHRPEEQKKQYQQSLEEIITPYAHRSVTSFILTGVPPEEERGYNDRGWPLLETTMIGSKGGDWNRWTFSHFDTNGTWVDAYAFFSEARLDGRKVPPSPEEFDELLERRRASAQARGLQLFTKGSDEARVPKLFRAAFEHMTRETKLVYDSVGWTDEDITLLARLLPSYTNLEQLQLQKNKIGVKGAEELEFMIPKLNSLQSLILTGNPLCREYPAREALCAAWQKAGKPWRMLEF